MIQTHALNLNISNIEISLIIPSVLLSVYILRAIEQHSNDIIVMLFNFALKKHLFTWSRGYNIEKGRGVEM